MKYWMILGLLACMPAALAQPAGETGLSARLYEIDRDLGGFPELIPGQPANSSFICRTIALEERNFPYPAVRNLYLELSGTLTLSVESQYQFRLIANDAARIWIDDQLVAEPPALEASLSQLSDVPVTVEFQVALKAGPHPIRVEYYNRSGSRKLSLEWLIQGIGQYDLLPVTVFSHTPDPAPVLDSLKKRIYSPEARAIPGDGQAVAGVHPALTVSALRLSQPLPRIGGLAAFSDGSLLACDWNTPGTVYRIAPAAGRADSAAVTRFAAGLAAPLGLAIVRDTAYVLQQQELTQLIDTDKDGDADVYRSAASGWPLSGAAGEYAYGLAYHAGALYAGLGVRLDGAGRPDARQVPDRGSLLRIDPRSGAWQICARNLTMPAGIGAGGDGIAVTDAADAAGRWLWVPGAAAAGQIWLPPDALGFSPAQPVQIPGGPYAGQWIYGDAAAGGLNRIAVEQAGGQVQGCVFRFSQGLGEGLYRFASLPDGSLAAGQLSYGEPGATALTRIGWGSAQPFEMLAVRMYGNGMEIEFTEPLKPGEGISREAYALAQWTPGQMVLPEPVPVRQAVPSADGRRVFLELPGLEARGQVLHLRIVQPPVSASDHSLWSTEAWYTLSKLPETQFPLPAAPLDSPRHNTLTAAEQAAGWKLLFDGKTLNGWRNFKSAQASPGWQARDGELCLVKGGAGDLVTAEEYPHFELSLEWKITEKGNSGIFFHVSEAPEYKWVWQTGPEYQLLDDLRHPDRKWHSHRAGSNYDLHPAAIEALSPVGEWNRTRLIVNQGRVEHWLNGYKIVEYTLGSPEWEALVAKSKFASMPGYGRAGTGKIALQDHGDPVCFRNIKIRRL
jgi:cytochrome c